MCLFSYRYLRPDVFQTMGNVTSLNLADNLLYEVPAQSLEYMPKLRTLTLGGNQIKALRANDLKVPLLNILINLINFCFL